MAAGVDLVRHRARDCGGGSQVLPRWASIAVEDQQRELRLLAVRVDQLRDRRIAVLGKAEQRLLVDDRAVRRLLGKSGPQAPLAAAQQAKDQEKPAHRRVVP